MLSCMTGFFTRHRVASLVHAREMSTMQHQEITIDMLLLHAAGTIETDRSIAIEAHLQKCAACAGVVDQARLIADLLREQRSRIVEPRADVASIAESLFTQVRPDLARVPRSQRHDDAGIVPEREAPSEGRRHILASVAFDSQGSSAFAGLRAAAAGPRHLAYQSELGDLDLQITPPLRPSAAGASWQLMGQLELRDPLSTGRSILFVQADLPAVADPGITAFNDGITADVDSTGYFVVELQSGSWAACMVMEQAILMFPGFTI